MINILTVTDQASTQLKKIIDTAPLDTIGVIVAIDKSGCSGYSYKLDFAKKKDVNNLEFVQPLGPINMAKSAIIAEENITYL